MQMPLSSMVRANFSKKIQFIFNKNQSFFDGMVSPIDN